MISFKMIYYDDNHEDECMIANGHKTRFIINNLLCIHIFFNINKNFSVVYLLYIWWRLYIYNKMKTIIIINTIMKKIKMSMRTLVVH